MRFGSVCSGIEAASVAWAPLGWSAAFVAEIEPFPKAVLAHHYPTVPDLGDMTAYRSWSVGAIDLLVGGTPCQAFSIAGLRKGLADPRGNLALVFLGILDHLRPEWVVWENVPGVRSSNGGRDFGAFLGALGELGYGWAYRSLDAQYFGLAQRRERVFVVGYRGDWRPPAAVLFEPNSLSGHPAPCRDPGAGTTIGTLGGASPGGGWRVGPDEAAAGQIVQCGGSNVGSPSLETYVAHSLRAEGFDASEDGTGRGTPLVAFQTRASAHQSMNPSTVTPSLDIGKAGGIAMFADPRRHDDRHGGVLRDLPCLNTSNNDLLMGQSVRRLTPRECERLQGFPDDYTLVPYRGKPAADGPRYKALGNSMAVPVMRWIGERIEGYRTAVAI
jgi:DNA (cytosine-5)-methyltransferase 1